MDYNIEQIFKLIAKYQCIKLIKCISLNYVISDDNINKEIANIIKQIDNLKINFIKKKEVKKKKVKKQLPNNNNRCQARIFEHNNIISKKYNKIIYGSRCKRHKINNSIYCKQHYNNLTHGNYLLEPSEYLKNHFVKEYNYYIKKNNIDKHKIINI